MYELMKISTNRKKRINLHSIKKILHFVKKFGFCQNVKNSFVDEMTKILTKCEKMLNL